MFLGFVILLIGALCLVRAFGVNIDFDIIWPSILVLFGVYLMAKNKKVDPFSIIIIFIGIWVELTTLDIISVSLAKIFWPVILIVCGITIIISNITFKKKINDFNKGKVVIKDKITYNCIFNGVKEKVKNNKFKAADIYAIFGGAEIDLTSIDGKEDIYINSYAIFGGVDLTVPEGYNIVINTNAVLGGVENKCDNDHIEGRKTIYLNCVAVFGGCDIK